MGKALQQFQCREDLWVRVEALAELRGLSPDDVVQAALIHLFTRAATTGASVPYGLESNGRAATPGASPSASGARPLYLYFEGQCYEVDQEQFIIGRGSKYSDLPIKDANISRRHCAIVRRDGQYYIKDLGSTNGVEFNGQRVDNHLIQEGTLYRLCDHEIRFSFTPPT